MKIRNILFISLFSVLSIVGFAQSSDPMEAKAREFVAQINDSNPAQFKEYVKQNFGGDFLKLPMDAHLNFFLSTKDSSRGFDILGLTKNESDQVTVKVKSKLTGEESRLIIRVDSKAPHKILGLGIRGVSPSNNESGKKLTDSDIASEMNEFTKRLADADVFSGSVLLARGDKVVFKTAKGTANKDFGSRNNIDTKFNLGSMNKMFTALSIAKLVEMGRLSVEDPLSKFIPDFPDEESAKKIKVKNLLSHTAGLGGYFTERWSNRARGSIRKVDEMMALAKPDERLRFEPGSNWQYSNTGILVLGKIVEVVSGQDYFEFVDKHILEPAGMKNTGCFALDQVNKNLAVGYDKVFADDGTYSFRNNIFMHVMRGGPHGGCYSTANDLHKFATALASGKIVKKELVKEFTTAKPDLGSPSYGYCFSVSSDGKRFGHGGGFTGISANIDIFRESGWVAIVLSNYSGASRPVTSKIRSLIASAK